MWVLAVIVFFSCYVDAVHRWDPLVKTKVGFIRGLRADDGEYSMYLGIPYAQVQMDNPFGPAIPQPKFNKVFNAVDDSAMCPQMQDMGTAALGSLDCLQLTVYVPNMEYSTRQLPVLVWIHGGSFNSGSFSRNIYGPKYLVRHNIIMVTLNYRVGPYGFLCLNTSEVPGNQGLKDQLLALRWVKDNIASFGGDPNKITLAGESAGAISIESHLLTSQKKLFNQVILQSGSSFVPSIFQQPDESKPLRIAEHLGFVTENISEALKFLVKTDVKSVIAAASKLSLEYEPCVEKEFENAENFLTDYPLNLDIPDVHNIPILTGFNNRELLLVYTFNPQYRDLDAFEITLQREFIRDDEYNKMRDLVSRFYIGDEKQGDATRQKLIDFFSDFVFNFPIQMSLKKFLENHAQDVYYYMFSYSGGRNIVKKKYNNTEKGASHADENGYLFDLYYVRDKPSVEDQLTIDRITTLWTNFVKYGNPTPETSELLPVKWTPVTQTTYTYLNIDRDLSVARRPYNDRMAFWELFFDVYKSKRRGYRPN